MLRINKSRTLIILLALVMLLAACSSDNGDDNSSTSTTADAGAEADANSEGRLTERGEVLKIALSTHPQTFDPARVQNAQLFYLQPVYDTLLRLDGYENVIPGLAEEWNYDGETLVLHLREGISFDDGSPFDAEVVKANIDRFVEVNGPVAGQVLGSFDKVEVIDQYTVELHFDTPSQTILIDLAQAVGMMMNPNSFDDPDIELRPAGSSGPYRLAPDNDVDSSRLVYEANDNYWDQARIHYNRIEQFPMPEPAARSNAMRAGEVDISPVDYSEIDSFQAEGYDLITAPGTLYYAFIMDREGQLAPPLSDERVRRALAMALDRQAFVDGVFFGYGTPTVQPYLEGEVGHRSEMREDLEYDPEGAKALLAEAGYANGFTVTAPTQPVTLVFSEAVAGYWKAIGVTLELDQVPGGSMAQAGRSGKYSIYLTPTAMTPQATWYQRWWAPGGSFNIFDIEDEPIISIAEKASNEYEPEKYGPLYEDMFELALGEGGFLPIARIDQILITTGPKPAHEWHINEFALNPVEIVP